MKKTLYTAAALAFGTAPMMPAFSMAKTEVRLVVGNPPPPPKFETTPPSREGQLWASGYWDWDGERHQWVGGHWLSTRPGQRYRQAEWVRDSANWRLKRGGWYVSEQAIPVYQYVAVAPPKPRPETVPPPRPGYLWATGYWEWSDHRHQWRPGLWLAERPGYRFRPAHWAQRDERWYLERERWEPLPWVIDAASAPPHRGGQAGGMSSN